MHSANNRARRATIWIPKELETRENKVRWHQEAYAACAPKGKWNSCQTGLARGRIPKLVKYPPFELFSGLLYTFSPSTFSITFREPFSLMHLQVSISLNETDVYPAQRKEFAYIPRRGAIRLTDDDDDDDDKALTGCGLCLPLPFPWEAVSSACHFLRQRRYPGSAGSDEKQWLLDLIDDDDDDDKALTGCDLCLPLPSPWGALSSACRLLRQRRCPGSAGSDEKHWLLDENADYVPYKDEPPFSDDPDETQAD